MVDPAPQAADPTAELANRGLHMRSGMAHYAREEFIPALRGNKAMKVYREMVDNTGLVGGMLFAIEMVLRQVAWRWEPKDDSPKALEVRDFVESCWNDMSTSPTDMLIDILTMLPFGFSAFEVVYKRRQGERGEVPSDFNDGRLGWRKIVHMPQDSIDEFLLDDTGGLEAIRQGRVILPIDKCALFRTRHDSPWGRSMLRSAYPPWLRRKRIEEIEAIGIERDLAGLPVMYMTPEIMSNGTRLAEYQDIVRNIRNDEQAGVILPALWDEAGNKLLWLELLGSPGSRTFDTNSIINRYSREIAISVLQDILLLGHEKVGTQALAVEKRDLSDAALTSWLDEIGSVISSHVTPRLLALNGLPTQLAPTWEHASLRDDDLAVMAQILSDLGSAGYTLAGDPAMEDWVRQMFGFPEVTEPESSRGSA